MQDPYLPAGVKDSDFDELPEIKEEEDTYDAWRDNQI